MLRLAADVTVPLSTDAFHQLNMQFQFMYQRERQFSACNNVHFYHDLVYLHDVITLTSWCFRLLL